MVMLETSYKQLKKLVGKQFSLQQLGDDLFNLGMELEEVNNDKIKVDITAERPDMVSAHGLARVLRAYYGIKNPDYTVKPPKKDYTVIIDKNVKEVRPFTACAIIKNLKLDKETIKEIIWVQEKLHATFGRNRKKVAIGIYPMEHISLPIYYKAAKPEHIKFQPLESMKVMTSTQILNNHKAGKEYGHLLEGKKVYPYFEDSKGNILSMPPIINSNETGRVTEKTKDIFIECSGHEFHAVSQTLNILVYLFKDLGGEIYQMELKYPDKKRVTPELNDEQWKISTKLVNQTLGTKFSPAQISKLLKKTMHKVTKTGKDIVEFNIPAIRTDIWHDADVVDDVLRAYGVNNLQPIFPKVATEGKVLLNTQIKKLITELFIGLGYQEVFTLSLTSEDDQFAKMNLQQNNYIKLGSSVEDKISMIRNWLLPEVLKSLVNNRNREYPQRLFEINEVVVPDAKKDVLCKNEMKIACTIAESTADFTKAKQVLVYLLEMFGKNAKFTAVNHNSFIEGRAAQVTVNNKNVGIIGELKPAVLTNWGMEVPVSGFEISIEAFK